MLNFLYENLKVICIANKKITINIFILNVQCSSLEKFYAKLFCQ